MATKTKKRPAAPANLSPEHLGMLRVFNTSQAMAYLQVSRSTLIELQRTGELPYSRLSARVIRFDRLQLDKWIAEKSVATTV